MSTLLLRLSGPMQSWGTDSRFEVRFSGGEPSKSGVIGLLCAALGKPREERAGDGFPTLKQMCELRMGVRIDRPGRLLVDYHTVGAFRWPEEQRRFGMINAEGKLLANPSVSRRYFLADACFLVGLSGNDDALLRQLFAALVEPVWQLYLGRKAFVPAEPVFLPQARPGTTWWGMALEAALRLPGGYPLLSARTSFGTAQAEDAPRLITEVESGEDAVLRQDVPLDFAARRFGVRFVREGSSLRHSAVER